MASEVDVLDVEQLERCIQKLHAYLGAQDYAGHDPYDGLESRVFQALPLRRWKWAQIAMTQFMKRSPWNVRSLLRVPRGRNPKGVALCVSALIHLARTLGAQAVQEETRRLLDWLAEHKAQGYSSFCWGYNFDWRSRAFFVAKNTPNLNCSIFVAHALLDAHEQFGDATDLEMARSTCAFLREHLLARASGEIYFRYIPGNDTAVYNVNLLAAALLARVYSRTGEPELLELAREAARFSVRRQNHDGSWYYGEAGHQRWIDNFHTGFNLIALSRYARYTGDETFRGALQKGRAFWEQQFFGPAGAAKYYPDAAYPLDVHCAAQAIVTHLEFFREEPQAVEKARRVAAWALRNLKSPDGTFYFQIHRFYAIRIPYLRWSQAWMFYALTLLLEVWRGARMSVEACVTARGQNPASGMPG